MSRTKKSRTMKNKLNIQTGSKRAFIVQGDMGKIPSKNKLSKHKNRQKSAYQKHLEEEKNKGGTTKTVTAAPTEPKQDKPEVAVTKDQPKPPAPTKSFESLSDEELWEQWENQE